MTTDPTTPTERDPLADAIEAALRLSPPGDLIDVRSVVQAQSDPQTVVHIRPKAIADAAAEAVRAYRILNVAANHAAAVERVEDTLHAYRGTDTGLAQALVALALDEIAPERPPAAPTSPERRFPVPEHPVDVLRLVEDVLAASADRDNYGRDLITERTGPAIVEALLGEPVISLVHGRPVIAWPSDDTRVCLVAREVLDAVVEAYDALDEASADLAMHRATIDAARTTLRDLDDALVAGRYGRTMPPPARREFRIPPESGRNPDLEPDLEGPGLIVPEQLRDAVRTLVEREARSADADVVRPAETSAARPDAPAPLPRCCDLKPTHLGACAWAEVDDDGATRQMPTEPTP